MLSTLNWQPLWLTLELAAVTTLLLLLLGTPLAWCLARSRSHAKPFWEAIIALPLVLPPTVLGFYLLLILGPQGWVGQLTQSLGLGLLPFSFAGLVLASCLYSLPFVVQPIQNAFASQGPRPMEVAATLGYSPLRGFFAVALPLARPGIVSGAVLGFAHTLGEFGVVLMVGGNIPGQTKVVSIAIYDYVERLDYASAHSLSLVMLVLSFSLLWLLYRLNQRSQG